LYEPKTWQGFGCATVGNSIEIRSVM